VSVAIYTISNPRFCLGLSTNIRCSKKHEDVKGQLVQKGRFCGCCGEHWHVNIYKNKLMLYIDILFDILFDKIEDILMFFGLSKNT